MNLFAAQIQCASRATIKSFASMFILVGGWELCLECQQEQGFHERFAAVGESNCSAFSARFQIFFEGFDNWHWMPNMDGMLREPDSGREDAKGVWHLEEA
jgi:hypothetical protein